MAKHKQQPLQVLGIEMKVIGQPGAVTALPPSEEIGVRYVVEWPMVAEVVPSQGEAWIGPLQAAVILEASDVDRLIAGLREAGWSMGLDSQA